MPTLTAFIPNFNHAHLVARALDALLAQSVPPDEILVIDDASSDESVAVISAYAARNPSIRFLAERENRGVCLRVQQALELARGDWFYSGAADDFVLPGFFAAAMEWAERHPTAGVAFGGFRGVSPTGSPVYEANLPQWPTPRFVGPREFLDEYLEVAGVGHSLGAATVFRKAPLEEVGGFRAELLSWADTFAIRAIALEHGACYLARPCVEVTVSPSTFSGITRADPERRRVIVETGSRLMRSAKFRDRFPESHVSRWETMYRLEVLDHFSLLADKVVPRDLTTVRRAYFELASSGEPFDRFVAALHRVAIRLARLMKPRR